MQWKGEGYFCLFTFIHVVYCIRSCEMFNMYRRAGVMSSYRVSFVIIVFVFMTVGVLSSTF